MSGIPQPHGGALVNGHSKMDVAGMEEIKVSASIQSEIENIADGIFSPLDGFLGQADFESVISSGKLVNGTTWTIPIVLDLSSADAAKAKNAGSVLLRGPDIAAVLDVAETFAYDKKKMSKGVFGTDDEKHPAIKCRENGGLSDLPCAPSAETYAMSRSLIKQVLALCVYHLFYFFCIRTQHLQVHRVFFA